MRNQCFAFFVSKDDASDMEDRQEVREVNIRLSGSTDMALRIIKFDIFFCLLLLMEHALRLDSRQDLYSSQTSNESIFPFEDVYSS